MQHTDHDHGSAYHLNVVEAFNYYIRHILAAEKRRLQAELGFSSAGSVSPQDWEVFGALLLGDRKTPGYGADLRHHEVKSAVNRSSFEYQYHRENGLAKLDSEASVDHLFNSYSPDYLNVTTRLVSGDLLSDFFDGWREQLIENYADNNRQRFRRSIPYGTVVELGEVVFRVQDGEIAL